MKKTLVLIIALLCAGAQVNTVGLVSHYKLWAGLMSAGKVFDYGFNGNTGDLNGTDIEPSYPGFLFNGTDDYIDMASPSGLPTSTTPRTTSYWMRTSTDADQVTLSYGDAGAGATWKEFIAVTTGYHWLFVDGGNKRGSTDLTDGIWHHLAITSDGVAVEDVILYVDGAVDTPDGSTAEPLQTAQVHFRIGVASDSSDPFDGNIDDVMIFNVEKSAAEIKSIYEITRSRYGR